MEGLAPLDIEVFDKDFVYQGKVARPQAVSVTGRNNAAGGGAFTLDSDADAVEALAAPGASVVCKYRHDPENPTSPMYLLGGPVSQVDLGGELLAPTRTFAVTDWWNILNGIICRAVPGSGLGSQGGQNTYYTSSGPMETVVKDLVSQNAGTVPTPIDVVASSGRGETVSIQVRHNKLTDRIFPALKYAHVSITVRQGPAGLILDAYEPTVHSEPLTVDSGIVAKGEGALLRPTVSRVLVRGGSEPSQVFQEYINSDVESLWGFCGWEYLEVSESTTSSYLEAKAWEVLNAGGRQASMSIELAETDEWRFGEGPDFFGLGDEVPILLPGMGEPVADAISEVEVTYESESGLVVTPRLGDRPMSPDQVLARALQKLAVRQRITQARG